MKLHYLLIAGAVGAVLAFQLSPTVQTTEASASGFITGGALGALGGLIVGIILL